MDIPNIPGLGFHPTNDELLTYYLKQRIQDYFQDQNRSATHSHTVPDIHLYSMHPRELHRQFKRLANVESNGREWVFFCVWKEKYSNSSRFERTIPNIGYWKITSKPKDVRSESTGNAIGSKSILTFYEQCHPKGIKTDWILHEYHLNASCLGYNVSEMSHVVCRLFNKGPGLNESAYEDGTIGCATYQTHGTHYQHTPTYQNTYKQEMWQSLPQIQQLLHYLSDHNIGGFTGWNGHYYNDESGSSSSGGFYNGGHGSGFHYPSNEGPSYYQQYQDGWNPNYH